MKGRWMIVALCLMLMGMADSFWARLILGVACIPCLFKEFHQHRRIVAFAVLVLFLLLSVPLKQDRPDKGVVTQLKKNYVIVSNGVKNVIVYTDASLRFGDEIVLQSELSSVVSYDNFDLSTFETYCKSCNIIGSLSIDNPQIIRHHFSIKDILYCHNLKTGNTWANSLLFSFSDNPSDYAWLLRQCGMYVSFLSGSVYAFFRLFFYRKKSSRLTLLFMSILCVLFDFPYVYMRAVISLGANELTENKREATALWLIGCCLIRPYGVCTASFLIPAGIRLLNTFLKQKDAFRASVFSTMIQLRFNGSVNILTTLLFPVLRTVFGSFYCFALIASLLPFNIAADDTLNMLMQILNSCPSFVLHHRLSLVGMAVVTVLLFRCYSFNRSMIRIMCAAVLFVNQFSACFRPYASVTWLDVGQGDCCIITTPFSSKALLIDTGGNAYKDVAADLLIPYLKSEGITSVDVIISHDDIDHSGALKVLQVGFNVENIYTQKQQDITFNNIDIFNPLADYNYDNDNDNSLICLFSIGKFTFLSLGDISANVEKDLISQYDNLQIDVCKLSHHGSDSATSEKFLDSCSISMAIICAGRNNRYHHPADAVVQRLITHQIDVFNTQSDHAIKCLVFSCFMIVVNVHKEVYIYTKTG